MTRAQRLVLVASILGSFVAFLDMSVVNVALPGDPQRPGRRHLGPAVDRRRLPGHARVVHPAGRLAVRPVRPQARVRGRADRIRRHLAARGRRPQRHRPDRRARAAGRRRARCWSRARWRSSSPTSAGRIRARRSAPGPPGPASRSSSARSLGGALVDVGSWRWVFAINVLPIAATLAVLARIPPEPRRTERSPVDLPGAVLCALGLGGIIFGLIEAPDPRLGRARDLPAARGRRRRVRGLPDLRALRAAPDAGLQAVPQPQLRDGQRRDGRDLRRPDRRSRSC